MITVFFSYSHHDEALRNELEKHLALLKRQGVIDTWHDRRIDAGEDVHEEIKEYLEKADIILLLVSADFLASDYCYDIEMQRALEWHQRGEARVIPVILRPCEWQKAPFGSLLTTPTDGKPVTKFENLDDAFLEVTRAIRKAADKLRPHVRSPTPVPNGKNERRMPVFFWTAIILLIMAGAGVGYWDAFYRQHVEYYANVTKRWGLPVDVGRLTDEDVRHRNISLKLTQRGRRGLVKEVRIVNSRGAYPPAFAYFPSVSLEGLNPLYNDSERFNLCRVTFEHDENDQIKNQKAYNRDDRLIYRLDYTAPNIAAYMMEVGISKAVTPSGVRYIKFVRSDRGLDQEVMGLGDDGKPRAGDKGGYGARRVFNSLGLPVELISLGADGLLAPSKVGVAKTTFSYDPQGNLIRSVRFGIDGQPVLGSEGAAEERMVYDPYGNVKEVTSYGTEGQLVTLKDPGVSGMAFAYDDQGNIIENKYFGPDRQLVRGPLGFAKYTAVWDGNGGVLQSFFSPNGKPTLFAGRAVKIRGRYDERGYLVEAAFLTNTTPPYVPMKVVRG